MSENLKKKFSKTDWKAAAGFRDILIHEYSGIDLELLWDSIMHKVPELPDEIAMIIDH